MRASGQGIVVVAALALASSAVADPIGRHTLARLETTRCVDACPVFSVVISDSGEVTWNGQQEVGAMGTRRARLSGEELAALRVLMVQLAKSGKVAQDSKVDCVDTSLSSYDLRVGNTVHHFIDDHCVAHRELDALEDRFDKLTGVSGWIAASPAVPTAVDEHTLAWLREVGGIGESPTYTVSVSTDGDVIWNGEEGVAALGDERAKLTPAALAELHKLAAEVIRHADGLPHIGCEDTSVSFYEFRVGSEMQEVVDDGCGADSQFAPLKRQIIELLRLGAWIGKAPAK